MQKRLADLLKLFLLALLLYAFGWYLSRLPFWYAVFIGVGFPAALLGAYMRRQEEAQCLRTSDVSKLTPLAYEDYCALALRDAGWNARTTPRQDQGVDVLAVLRGTKVAIQCKMYTHPVSNRAVQEIVAGRLHYGADIAVVVSPAPYTRSAQELAASTRVLLLHHDQLAQLERLARIPKTR
jgi:HJR/Mrr/RecB family endonuclease